MAYGSVNCVDTSAEHLLTKLPYCKGPTVATFKDATSKQSGSQVTIQPNIIWAKINLVAMNSYMSGLRT